MLPNKMQEGVCTRPLSLLVQQIRSLCVYKYNNVVNGNKKDVCSLNMKILKIFPDLWYKIQNYCKPVAYVTGVIVVKNVFRLINFNLHSFKDQTYARFLKHISKSDLPVEERINTFFC